MSTYYTYNSYFQNVFSFVNNRNIDDLMVQFVEKQTLNDFCTETIRFHNGKRFNPSDKDRFYDVDSQDGSTVVALSELILTGNQGYNEVINFISRTEKGIHAEEQFIEQAKEVIQEARKNTNLTEVSLVTMSTRSPCSRCRHKLKDFLTQLSEGQTPTVTVKFTLRISELYHETRSTKGYEVDSEVKTKLQSWKGELGKVVFRLEPISVTTELPGYETQRQAKCATCTKRSEECSECQKQTLAKKEASKKSRQISDTTIKTRVDDINKYIQQKLPYSKDNYTHK